MFVASKFQSTRPSRASTHPVTPVSKDPFCFNPQGPRGPRLCLLCMAQRIACFNPQGPRGPRPALATIVPMTRSFNPQGPRGPRHQWKYGHYRCWYVSIHKALAGLDSKTIQQSLHIPLTFYALCPPLLISTSSIHSPSLFSRLFRCFSGANLPGISC